MPHLEQFGRVLAPLILLLASGLASVVRRAAKKKEPPAAAGASSPPPAAAESDEAERTRRLREEIRRKIAGRQRPPSAAVPAESEASEMPAPPPVRGYPIDPFGGAGRRLLRPFPQPAAAPPDFERRAAEKIRAIEEARTQEIPAPEPMPLVAQPSPPAAPSPVSSAPTSSFGAAVLADLRDPGSARRAIVLREILGPPLGLRKV
jgi:hypothetical protein